MVLAGSLIGGHDVIAYSLAALMASSTAVFFKIQSYELCSNWRAKNAGYVSLNLQSDQNY